MPNYRITINIVGNASKSLNKMIRDLAGVNKGVTGVISKFGVWGRVIGQVATATTGLVKGMAKAQGLFMFGGGRMLQFGANVLGSAQMSEGIRLLQRRQQARLGFGPEYERAQRRADMLAVAHGLNPADVVASLNVLTGLKVGRSKLSLAQAARFTQAGGLIAQQAGLPFETVMVNIQQILAQSGKNARDIRQLITHAPILSRYASQHMEARGISGVSSYDYLNNKEVFTDVLQRYINENPSLLAMQGQGVVRMAQTEFYARLAENPKWLEVADKYSGMLKEIGEAAYDLVTAFTDSTTINASIRAFIALLKDIPGAIDNVAKWFDEKIGPIARFFGKDWGGYKEVGFIEAEREKAIKNYVSSNFAALTPYGLKRLGKTKASSAEIHTAIVEGLREGDPTFKRFVTETLYNPNMRAVFEGAPSDSFSGKKKLMTMPVGLMEQKMLSKGDYIFSSVVTSRVSGTINRGAISQYIARPSDDTLPPLTGADFKDGAGLTPGGTSVGGYGRDRKALVINFNAPIVEWDSTINTDDPNEVVQEVSASIESAASKAIQIALRGATGKMNQRW